ncbi:MAG: LamG domain-containing protein, partial [Thermoproteales archaeon]|nr:LamG domain-containing protein [Thermoproteales archaeon]
FILASKDFGLLSKVSYNFSIVFIEDLDDREVLHLLKASQILLIANNTPQLREINFSYEKTSANEYENYIISNLKEYVLLGVFKNLKVYIRSDLKEHYNLTYVNITCLYFDGVDDYVEVPHSDVLVPSNGLTIAVYFYPEQLNARQRILVKSSQYYLTLWETNRLYCHIQADNGTWYEGYLTNTELSLNEWYFGVMVWNGSTIKGYLNGEYEREFPAPATSLYPSTSPITIGMTRSSEWFKGRIAYILIYNRALNDNEIRQLYEDIQDFSLDDPITDGLVLYFNSTCINRESNIWWDLSGNNNHGIIFGAKTITCKVWSLPLFESVANDALNYAKIIEYVKINPTLWKVKVNATKPFFLTFAETYDPMWEARVYKDGELIEIVSPVPTYGVINGFWINQTGKLEIVLRYIPQDWFENGLTISLTTFILNLFYVFYNWRKERGDRWTKRLEEAFKRTSKTIKS